MAGPKRKSPRRERPGSIEERELDEFLAGLPRWEQRILTLEEGEFSPSEVTEKRRSGRGLPRWETEQRYLDLLSRCPARYREYRRRSSQLLESILPPVRRGRPAMSVLAQEAADLAQAGHNPSQISYILNHKHGKGTTTAERVRHLLSYRNRRFAPSRK